MHTCLEGWRFNNDQVKLLTVLKISLKKYGFTTPDMAQGTFKLKQKSTKSPLNKEQQTLKNKP